MTCRTANVDVDVGFVGARTSASNAGRLVSLRAVPNPMSGGAATETTSGGCSPSAGVRVGFGSVRSHRRWRLCDRGRPSVLTQCRCWRTGVERRQVRTVCRWVHRRRWRRRRSSQPVVLRSASFELGTVLADVGLQLSNTTIGFLRAVNRHLGAAGRPDTPSPLVVVRRLRCRSSNRFQVASDL